MDPTSIARNLRLEDGLWVAGDRAVAVSFPEGSHEVLARLEERSYWFLHRNACILAAVERFPPPGVLCEAGAGNGFVARALQDAGFSVVALEPYQGAARTARARGVETVVCASFEEAGFVDGALGGVALFDVLEHIEDEGAFLAACRRALAPGARLYLTVPAHGWLWSDVDESSGHFRRYTLPGLSRAVRRAGFEPELETYYFFALALPILLGRTLPYRLGRARPTEEGGLVAHDPRVDRAAHLALDWERRLIGRTRLPFGASCLMVARRP